MRLHFCVYMGTTCAISAVFILTMGRIRMYSYEHQYTLTGGLTPAGKARGMRMKTPFVTLDRAREIVREFPTPFHIYD